MAAKARKSASKSPRKKPAAKAKAPPAKAQVKAKTAAAAPRPMTAKQQRFVEEYLVDLDATKAAIRAGYAPKAAGQQGYQLLQIPSIAAAIRAKRDQVTAKLDISIERVLLEAARLAFFDARKLFNADGSPKKLTELDDDTAAAIQGVDVATIGNQEIGIGQVLKYKAADKNSAVDRFFKYHGLFKRDNEQSNPGGAMADFLAALSARGSRLPTVKPGSKA